MNFCKLASLLLISSTFNVAAFDVDVVGVGTELISEENLFNYPTSKLALLSNSNLMNDRDKGSRQNKNSKGKSKTTRLF